MVLMVTILMVDTAHTEATDTVNTDTYWVPMVITVMDTPTTERTTQPQSTPHQSMQPQHQQCTTTHQSMLLQFMPRQFTDTVDMVMLMVLLTIKFCQFIVI